MWLHVLGFFNGNKPLCSTLRELKQLMMCSAISKQPWLTVHPSHKAAWGLILIIISMADATQLQIGGNIKFASNLVYSAEERDIFQIRKL